VPDSYKVIFKPEVVQAIIDRADYIAEQSGSGITGEHYMDGIYAFCKSLSSFPNRSINRDDIFPGLRITNYKGTTVITYLVREDAREVHIAGIFHSSQDYESQLKADEA